MVGKPADYPAGDRSGETIISLDDAEGWRSALGDIIELLREGGRVIIALAPSWRVLPIIQEATWDLAQACQAHSFEIEVASWDPQHPSLGEALMAGVTPQVQALSTLSPPEWTYKLSSRTLMDLPPSDLPAPMGLEVLRARLEEGLREAFL